MEIENMKGALNLYSVTSNTINEKKEVLSKLKLEFENQNKGLIESISNLNEELDTTKNWVKVEAEKEFIKTGEKKLLGGIGIRVSNLLDYDSTTAFDWAKEHKLCLTLDKKEFEKIAKSQELDFVNKSEKITVTFPKEIILD